jgi:hypothetical protein
MYSTKKNSNQIPQRAHKKMPIYIRIYSNQVLKYVTLKRRLKYRLSLKVRVNYCKHVHTEYHTGHVRSRPLGNRGQPHRRAVAPRGRARQLVQRAGRLLPQQALRGRPPRQRARLGLPQPVQRLYRRGHTVIRNFYVLLLQGFSIQTRMREA